MTSAKKPRYYFNSIDQSCHENLQHYIVEYCSVPIFEQFNFLFLIAQKLWWIQVLSKQYFNISILWQKMIIIIYLSFNYVCRRMFTLSNFIQYMRIFYHSLIWKTGYKWGMGGWRISSMIFDERITFLLSTCKLVEKW